MNIIIVGCGKVGTALVQHLSGENHSVTVIDKNKARVDQICQDYDVMGFVGNGASIGVLKDAGLETADVFIAVTTSDELNLLCCMFAKKNGECHTIARVRNPSYSREIEFIKKQTGISMIINPELAAAKEISRLLRFPGAEKIDTFADGRVLLTKIAIKESMRLDGVKLKDIASNLKVDILICAIERDGNVMIPGGDFVIRSGDIITFVSTMEKARDFFKKVQLPTKPVKSTMIIGGGAIGYYLAQDLVKNRVQVRVIERNPERCQALAEDIPEAEIICADASDRDTLLSEGLESVESFVTLTNFDEENVFLTLFARKYSRGKMVTKVNRLEFDDILENLNIGSTILPKYITSDLIVQYVRALQNEAGNNIKTLYLILDDSVEALEFEVHEESTLTNVPLHQLKLKKNLLVCCINRGNQVIIPRGSDCIKVGDSVIIVTLQRGLDDIKDIMAD